MRYVIGIVLLGGLLMGTSAPAHGQDGRQYGFTLGTSWATMQSPADNLGGQFVLVGGGVIHQPLYESLSLRSGLLLSQEGTEVRSDEGGAIEYTAAYAELPLLLHLEAPPLRSITLYGEAGGFGALKLFERQTPGEGDLNIPLRTGVSFFRRFNAGLAAGLGATIPIGEQRLNLTVRRTWGLPDVARNVEDQPFPEVAFPANGTTRTWSLLLRFGL